MILALFEWLVRALEAQAFLGLIASFIWGVLSILLSPCHLASIPLIVGFIDSQGKVSPFRAFLFSSLFSGGILAAISFIGLVTGLMGRFLGDLGPYTNYFLAAILFFVGLCLLEIINFPLFNFSEQTTYFKNKGFLAALVLGLVFGVVLGPCTFAYMAPMLGLVFKIAATNFVYAFWLILFYALGHCSVIIIAGTFVGFVQQYLKWNEKSQAAVILKKICGVLVIIAAGYFLWLALK